MKQAIEAWKAGDLRRAEHECRRVLQSQPWNGDALNLLGAIAGKVGNHEAAVALMKNAVSSNPNVLEFRENLARTLFQAKQFAEARQVIDGIPSERRSPGLAALYGVTLAQLGEHQCAIEQLSWAAKKEPKNPGHLYNLAEIHRRTKRNAEAIELFKSVLKLAPTHQDSLNNLSGVLMHEGDFVEAARTIQRLLDINPRSAQAYGNLGTLLSNAGDPLAAISAFRNATRLDPGNSRAKFQLANQLVPLGEFDEAEAIVEQMLKDEAESALAKVVHARLLERKGDVAGAQEVLDTIPDDRLTDPDVVTIRAIVLEQNGKLEEAADLLKKLIDSDERTDDWIGIHFSMASLLDKLGRYDEAFPHLKIGNDNRKRAFESKLRKANTAEDLSSENERNVIQQVRSCGYHNVPSSNLDVDRPIFILGMPRSGTSLTEQILACHSQVFAAGELRAFHEAVASSYSMEHETGDSTASNFRIVDSDPSEGSNCMLPCGWPEVQPKDLDAIGEHYLDTLSKLNATSPHVTDKMPFNFFMVPIIHKVFPNAKIIHCLRNPIDTCLSCYFQNFAAGNEYSFDLSDLGKFYRRYEEHMQNWEELGIPIYASSYENLVNDAEKSVRAILDYCELDWEPSCLDSHKLSRPIATASYQQVREPIHTNSIEKWRRYEKWLDPLLHELNANN